MKPKRPAGDIREQFPHVVVADPAMISVLRQAAALARARMDVLLIGESGVGKELLAQGMHRLSQRADGPFIAVNVAAFPETLFESELFGHEKGAFTGASERYVGRFEQARGGTLFLDEIGHLPRSQQSRLLRVLQEKAFYRLGGAKLIRADVRVMAATDQDLSEMVEAGAFLGSLLFRFHARLEIPPLRQRRADIPALVGSFLPIYNRKYEKNLVSVSTEALSYLERQPWPGNVRQLLGALEVAVVYADSRQRMLEVSDFRSVLEDAVLSSAEVLSRAELTALDHMSLDQVLAWVVRRRLAIYRGNKTKAAESLKVSRVTFWT
ncbi:MAG: hypothetical protein D6723_10385, partial [Acidobacteria bacterium]